MLAAFVVAAAAVSFGQTKIRPQGIAPAWRMARRINPPWIILVLSRLILTRRSLVLRLRGLLVGQQLWVKMQVKNRQMTQASSGV